MEKVFSFSEINPDFFNSLKYKRAAVDASFLVKVFFDDLFEHRQCVQILDKLREQGISFVANATVKSELLDFARKVALTRLLFHELPQHDFKFPKDTLEIIRKLKSYKENAAQHEKRDPILVDAELKEVRDSLLSRQGMSGISKWSKVCEVYLTGRIHKILSLLEESGIRYLSYDELKSADLLESGRTLEWKNAVSICEASGVGFWDSMLINFTETAKVDVIISLDKDLAYAYAAQNLFQKRVLTSQKNVEFLEKLRI